MQFEDLSENFKLGIEDFRKFNDAPHNLNTYKSSDLLKISLLYFILWKSGPEVYWKYMNSPSQDSLKEIDTDQLSFVFDLADKKNYWLKEK